jgi:purine-binding chemotaxis protein CheW
MSALHVICKIGDSEYAIPAEEVFQMEAFTGVTPVPGTPSYVAGVVQVRQQVVPLVNARTRFGLLCTEPTAESRMIVLRFGSRLVAVLVDSAREVLNLAPEHFQDTSGLIQGQCGGFVKAVAQLKGRIILLINTLKMVGEGT